MEIFTLGTSNRTSKEFLKLLKKYKIKNVADVRRFPTSKFEHFKKENLKEKLEKEGINYFHLEKLGGFRGGYKEYTKKKEFKEGLERLLEIARKEKTVILCAEKLFFRCHRRYISNILFQKGHKIFHIIEENKFQEHKLIFSPDFKHLKNIKKVIYSPA